MFPYFVFALFCLYGMINVASKSQRYIFSPANSGDLHIHRSSAVTERLGKVPMSPPSTVPTGARGLGVTASCLIPNPLCSDAERGLGSLSDPLKAKNTC